LTIFTAQEKIFKFKIQLPDDKKISSSQTHKLQENHFSFEYNKESVLLSHKSIVQDEKFDNHYYYSSISLSFLIQAIFLFKESVIYKKEVVIKRVKNTLHKSIDQELFFFINF